MHPYRRSITPAPMSAARDSESSCERTQEQILFCIPGTAITHYTLLQQYERRIPRARRVGILHLENISSRNRRARTLPSPVLMGKKTSHGGSMQTYVELVVGRGTALPVRPRPVAVSWRCVRHQAQLYGSARLSLVGTNVVKQSGIRIMTP